MTYCRTLFRAAAALAALCLICPVSAPARDFTPENPLIIKMTSFAMPTHPVVVGGFNLWAEELKEKSGGRMVVEIYNPNTVCPDADVYDCVKSGVIDMGAQVTQRVKGGFPLSNVIDLPFIYPSAEVASMVFNQLFAEFPELRQEYAETKLFGAWSGAPYQLHTVKKPIHTLADVKGLKIGAISSAIVPIVESMGAAAVSVPMSDCYLAIQRGQVDAIAAPYAFVVSTKIYEATKYSTTFNVAPSGVYMCMNQMVYDSMPADLKAILDASLTTGRFRNWGHVTDQGAKHDLVTIQAAGQQVFELSDEEFKKGREATRPVVDTWFADCSRRGKGDIAQALYHRAVELSDQYSKELAQ